MRVTQAAAKAQKHAIEGQIIGLMQQLNTLAAHPDHKGASSTPHYVSLRTDIKPAADYDGMLGSLVLEQGLGMAFGEAANDLGIDVQMASDLASEYITDRKKDRQGRGQGTFALGEHKTICNQFNDTHDQTALEAFYNDYDTRLDIEETLAALDRDLSRYQCNAFML